MKLVYGVKDRPKAGKTVLFALQQLLAILAATIAVPNVINLKFPAAGMSQAAALFGAGVGTLIYLLFTRFKSPVFLGSSFAFLGSMLSAFAGAGSMMSLGYLGLIVGAVLAGIVYVILAIVVKFAGVKWIEKIMPAVVIGPTVAIIGLSLAGSAIGQATSAVYDTDLGGYIMNTNSLLCLLCALVTLGVTIACSVYGKKMTKMIPFIIGILSGYALAAIFTAFSYIKGAEAMRIMDFTKFAALSEGKSWYPDFAFLHAFDFKSFKGANVGAFIGTVAVAYIPVAFVVFAEHIADHKNISSIIETDLLKDPGLHRTLLGDGIGSMAGALFGGCPNTTYGESVGCVAISGNASIITILVTAVMAIVCAFLAPFTIFLATIPQCVMGGVCVALYGFIAVSGLKMISHIDLGDNKNLFVVSTILIAGVGGLSLSFVKPLEGGGYQGLVTVTEVACALILGILVNVLVNIRGKKSVEQASEEVAEEEKKDGLQKEDVVSSDGGAEEEK